LMALSSLEDDERKMLKKALVAMSLVGLALNALAQETYKYAYNWTFNIVNATYDPSELPTDMVGYILGTDKAGKVTEIVRLEFKDAAIASTITGTSSAGDKWVLTPAIDGGKRYFTYTEMSPGQGEGYFASFAAALRTDQDVATQYNAGTFTVPDYSKNVTLVLESATGSAQFKVNAASGGSVQNLQFNADFSVVPEPTSGLLMLMGLAGLALKRKKAA